MSGGGGADLSILKIDTSERRPHAEKVYGFTHVSVNAKQMTLRHLDSSGLSLHAFTKTPEGRIELLP
jgi:tartrate-resistant acid phosphatase type 5